MRIEIDLHDEARAHPRATAVVQPMDEGDIIVGVRPYNAHPDSEFAIVRIAVDADGALVVDVYDGDGCAITAATKVSQN